MEFVKHYLFCDYNNGICSPPTEYRIFLKEKLREGLNKRIAPQKIKIKVKSDWDKMFNKEKKKYNNKSLEKSIKKEKEIFGRYEVNKVKEKLRDIYDIITGIKPKKQKRKILKKIHGLHLVYIYKKMIFDEK